jgi:hypothetical protein
MRRLLINGISYAVYVMVFVCAGFWIAVNYLDNHGTVYVFAIVWLILTISSGLALMGKR